MDGVILTPLKQIYHPKGNIFHAMRKSDSGFSGFGEAYFSTIIQGEIKGWKLHTKMILNIIVPMGEIEFVLFDKREKSGSKGQFFSVNLSLSNYQRLTIPHGIWVSFRGIKNENLLLNLASMEHEPSEALTVPLDEFKYTWKELK